MQSTDISLSIYSCPVCGSHELGCEAYQAVCSGCKTAFPILDGLPDFLQGNTYYWGELERSAMRAVVESGGSISGALQKLSHTDRSLAEYLKHYALDRRRAGWKFLTSLPQSGRVLDFGCGWGSIAVSLAHNFNEVYVSDIVPERVKIVVKRGAEEGLDNIKGCFSSGWPKLPFRDGVFDLIVVNGVLEWLPDSVREGSPEDVQLAYLKEFVRILKPAGQLYLGIENRYSARYFLGRPEDHTKLKYVSLLPRFAGRIYHRLVKHEEYRVYTHGCYKLTKMLRKAGFSETKVYCPYTDYREFDRIIDPEDTTFVRRSFSPTRRVAKIMKALIRVMPLLKWASHSYSVVSGKRLLSSFVDRLLADLHARGILDEVWQVCSYKLTASAVVLVGLVKDDSSRILSLPLDARAEVRVKRDVASLNFLHESLSSEKLMALAIPQIIGGNYEGTCYSSVDCAKGRKMSEIDCWRMSEHAEMMAVEWISRFHAATASLDPATFPFLSCFDNELKCIEEYVCKEVMDSVKAYLKKVSACELLLTSVHGDYHQGNIFDLKGRIEMVIDWDLMMREGLPVWDVMTLYCHSYFEQGKSWPEAYRFATKKVYGGERSRALRGFLTRLGLGESDVLAAVLSFPLLMLKNKMLYGDRDLSVIEDLQPIWQSVLSEATDSK